MDPKIEKQMKIMTDAVQGFCDEEIIAAMTCSHAGSMGSVLISKLLDGAGAVGKSFNLPNPVFIAVGTNTVYAFKYKPRGFKFKIKKEVARWEKRKLKVTAEETKNMCYFVLNFESGDLFPMEVPIIMGGKELVNVFLDALGAEWETS